ncbi:Leucine-rich repeat-containing protein 49 [Dinochytrium kinnereticum]|nr:Leucine-rich repeat-containing protein 49 [Dinochytrium kinnereticum]
MNNNMIKGKDVRDSKVAWSPLSVNPMQSTFITQSEDSYRSNETKSIQQRSMAQSTQDIACAHDELLSKKDVDLFQKLLVDEREVNPERLNLNKKGLQLPQEDRLRLLNYQSNHIKVIEGLQYLRNLVFLDFYNNSLERIGGIENLVNLRVLMLGRNRLTKIESLEKLSKLDVLDLHSNTITKIDNISHLHELRVLNLEDNRLTKVESLPTKSLTELNIKRNQINSITGAQHMHSLRRLVMGCNNVASFECISDLLFVPSLTELSLESNPINSDEFYRAILVNRIRALRILDGKRVTDEERRHAAKIAKREAERRKENDKNIVLSEEKYLKRLTSSYFARKRAILHIQSKWESEQVLSRSMALARVNDAVLESAGMGKPLTSRYLGAGKSRKQPAIVGDEANLNAMLLKSSSTASGFAALSLEDCEEPQKNVKAWKRDPGSKQRVSAKSWVASIVEESQEQKLRNDVFRDVFPNFK